MTLVDIRKLTIRQQYRVHFRLRNGMECIVNEMGVAQVPELKRPADFNLEEELKTAEEFLLEPAAAPAPKTAAPKPRKISRAELTSMTATPTAAATHDHDHDDE